jgi:hypothetical protein
MMDAIDTLLANFSKEIEIVIKKTFTLGNPAASALGGKTS